MQRRDFLTIAAAGLRLLRSMWQQLDGQTQTKFTIESRRGQRQSYWRWQQLWKLLAVQCLMSRTIAAATQG